jgi:hypothetical protein
MLMKQQSKNHEHLWMSLNHISPVDKQLLSCNPPERPRHALERWYHDTLVCFVRSRALTFPGRHDPDIHCFGVGKKCID